MDLGLEGRRALVMGASRGLGHGIAERLAAEGCDLVLAARNRERLAAHGERLKAAHGVAATTIGVDLGEAASLDACIGEVETIGGVDILVNIGGGPPPSPALEVSEALWRRHFEAAVLGIITVTNALVPAMRARRWGRVLTITSSGVVQPIPGMALSNTLRASLVAYAKTLAGEVAADGVTVNVIVPGRIATERVAELDALNAQRLGIDEEEVRRRSIAGIPVGRYGTVEEFAAAAAFLVSAPASYVTGQMMRVDGGLIRSI